MENPIFLECLMIKAKGQFDHIKYFLHWPENWAAYKCTNTNSIFCKIDGYNLGENDYFLLTQSNIKLENFQEILEATKHLTRSRKTIPIQEIYEIVEVNIPNIAKIINELERQ
jgi:hypothetical protein